MSLDMFGHVDHVFESVKATRKSKSGGAYVSGKWVAGTETETIHSVNVQPLSMKEINFLTSGGERIVDARKVYITDGTSAEISEADTWILGSLPGEYRAIMVDNGPWVNYCKLIVTRIDA